MELSTQSKGGEFVRCFQKPSSESFRVDWGNQTGENFGRVGGAVQNHLQALTPSSIPTIHSSSVFYIQYICHLICLVCLYEHNFRE